MSAAPLYILAIDQGTTGSTCLVVDISQAQTPAILARGYCEVPQHYPQPGWVEHALPAIWQSVLQACAQALGQFEQRLGIATGDGSRKLAAVCLSNQRETAAAWHQSEGPQGHAIVWQDRRTEPHCVRLQEAGMQDLLQRRTGLVFDPYFSASKFAWQLRHDAKLRRMAKDKTLRLGTIDSFLIWQMSAGQVHRTDTTNAARTGLFDIHERRFASELCALWDDIPMDALPEVRASDSEFCRTKDVPGLVDGIPVIGVCGDQHASLIGQGCLAPGQAKCTLGTGGFVLLNTGTTARASKHGLLTTIAYDLAGECAYALEGSTFVAGALVQWLRDGLGIIEKSADINVLAAQVADNGGVTLVPALTGLGAPYWRPHAKGLIAGISRGTTKAHIARAALEGIAWQSADLLQAMRKDSAMDIDALRVDGGAAASDMLLQMHADFLQMPIERPASVEGTALGAALCGAVGLGVKSVAEVAGSFVAQKRFSPQLAAGQRDKEMARWHEAVALS